ncbi:MAG: hypothetical protein H7234_05135 [Herminiimonas sp.]|nr:hypothetical protein [Herminiimonas sp.]
MSQQGGETGIPILTEVIQVPVYGVDTPERRAEPRATPSAPSTAAATVLSDAGVSEADTQPAREPEPVDGIDTMLQTGATSQLDAGDTSAFERVAASVRNQVLQQLLDHADATLELRIRDILTDHFQLAISQLTTQLTTQLRLGLQETLEALLAEAIAKEPADRQISKI